MKFLGFDLLPDDELLLGDREYGDEPFLDRFFRYPLPASDLFWYLKDYEQEDREFQVFRNGKLIYHQRNGLEASKYLERES